jgi:hypothetical protein
MPVSFVGKRSRADVTQFVLAYLTPAALNDITKTGPRDDANWPRSNWNGGRDQIGIGRLRWNPHVASCRGKPGEVRGAHLRGDMLAHVPQSGY